MLGNSAPNAHTNHQRFLGDGIRRRIYHRMQATAQQPSHLCFSLCEVEQTLFGHWAAHGRAAAPCLKAVKAKKNCLNSISQAPVTARHGLAVGIPSGIGSTKRSALTLILVEAVTCQAPACE